MLNTLVLARGIPGVQTVARYTGRCITALRYLSLAEYAAVLAKSFFSAIYLSIAFSKSGELESQLFPLPTAAPLTTDIQKKLSRLTTCLSGAVKLPWLFDEERTVKERRKSSLNQSSSSVEKKNTA